MRVEHHDTAHFHAAADDGAAWPRRFGLKLPRYNQIVNALTWMSHSQALKRMSKDYVVRSCRGRLMLPTAPRRPGQATSK